MPIVEDDDFCLKNKIKLRFGFKQASGTSPIIKDNLSNFPKNLKSSFGIGIPIKVWHKQYISFDTHYFLKIKT